MPIETLSMNTSTVPSAVPRAVSSLALPLIEMTPFTYVLFPEPSLTVTVGVTEVTDAVGKVESTLISTVSLSE